MLIQVRSVYSAASKPADVVSRPVREPDRLSSMMSELCSIPIESRIVSGQNAGKCAALQQNIWRWVVDAGMAGEGFRVADIGRAAFDQLQRKNS